MARITNEDLKKNILKHRTEEAMRHALRQFVNQEHELHIPPDDEDADMVISDVIEELLEARKKLSLLEPLRDALSLSEQAWQEALKDPCGPGKVLEPVIRPLQSVEAPLHAMQNMESSKEDALYSIGPDGYHGSENLEVLQEEQEG